MKDQTPGNCTCDNVSCSHEWSSLPIPFAPLIAHRGRPPPGPLPPAEQPCYLPRSLLPQCAVGRLSVGLHKATLVASLD